MVRARYYSNRTHSRHQSCRHAAPTRSSHGHYGSSKMSTRMSSRRGRAGNRSIDSVYSRDSSYDRLISASKYSDMSRHHRPPHYDRMVCEAVARLKSRKGSSIRDIAKNLEKKYPDVLKGRGQGTAKKVIATAKKLVKAGKLVKDGSHYRLTKTSLGSKDSNDYYYDDDSHSRHGSHGYSHQSSRRGRSHKRSQSCSESRSRSRSQSPPPPKQRRQSTSYRRRKKASKRGRGGWKRRTKRKRRVYKKKLAGSRRQLKQGQTKRPKSEKLQEGDSSQNKGWFGGWFAGRSAGDTKSAKQGNDKGSSSKPANKKLSERKETGGT